MREWPCQLSSARRTLAAIALSCAGCGSTIQGIESVVDGSLDAARADAATMEAGVLDQPTLDSPGSDGLPTDIPLDACGFDINPATTGRYACTIPTYGLCLSGTRCGVANCVGGTIECQCFDELRFYCTTPCEVTCGLCVLPTGATCAPGQTCIIPVGPGTYLPWSCYCNPAGFLTCVTVM